MAVKITKTANLERSSSLANVGIDGSIWIDYATNRIYYEHYAIKIREVI